MNAARAPIASLADESLDSQNIVIGAILRDPKRIEWLIEIGTVTSTDFSQTNQKVLDAVLGLYYAGKSFDISLVLEELRRRRQYWQGAAVYLSSLTEGLYRDIPIDEHCARIRAVSIRRQTARLCQRILDGCHDLGFDPAALISELRTGAAAIEAPAGASDLGLVCGADVRPETIEYLNDYVPKARLSLLVANPGDGKTTAAIGFGSDVTRGVVTFSGSMRSPQRVLYLSNEDSPGELRARFDRAGGNPALIFFESAERAISLGQTDAVEAAVRKHDAALVIIDTVTSHFGAGADFHKASEVAAVLSPLVAMAQRTGAAVLGLMHLSKANQSHALYRVQGSTAFAGAARSIMAIGPDPSDPNLRVFTHLKSNGGALGPSRRFTIGERGLVWGDITDLRAQDVLRAEAPAEERSALSGARDFLVEALKLGSREANELLEEAKGLRINEKTLHRAKRDLGVKSRKKSLRGGWIWWLQEEGSIVQ